MYIHLMFIIFLLIYFYLCLLKLASFISTVPSPCKTIIITNSVGLELS